MKDAVLLKIALITSIVGVVGLFFIMQSSELKESSIAELEIDGAARIVGVVEKVVKRGNITSLTLSQSINAVVFESIDVKEGRIIEVIGEVVSHNGKKEIMIEKIKLI